VILTVLNKSVQSRF